MRRAHYLQKLAHLVKVSEHDLEAALSGIKTSQVRVKIKEQAVPRHPPLSRPFEEECLAWLVHYPELKAHCQGLLPEYFENSENREVFLAWQKVNDLKSLKEKLDAAIYEHLDYLITKSLPPTNQTEREGVIASYILRLHEEYLRSLAAKRGEALALAAESGGTTAELAKLQEQGAEVSAQLGEVFTKRSQKR